MVGLDGAKFKTHLWLEAIAKPSLLKSCCRDAHSCQKMILIALRLSFEVAQYSPYIITPLEVVSSKTFFFYNSPVSIHISIDVQYIPFFIVGLAHPQKLNCLHTIIMIVTDTSAKSLSGNTIFKTIQLCSDPPLLFKMCQLCFHHLSIWHIVGYVDVLLNTRHVGQ